MCDSLYYECVYPVLAAMTATVEPVFLLRRELPPDSGSRFDTLDLFSSRESERIRDNTRRPRDTGFMATV